MLHKAIAFNREPNPNFLSVEFLVSVRRSKNDFAAFVGFLIGLLVVDKALKLKISKTDAAKRQLETAIRLWLNNGDPVSIHTLAAAAHQIIHDLDTKHGKPTILRGLDIIPSHLKRRVRKVFNKPANFLKHADKDQTDVLDFPPEITEVFILDAIETYYKQTVADPQH